MEKDYKKIFQLKTIALAVALVLVLALALALAVIISSIDGSSTWWR